MNNLRDAYRALCSIGEASDSLCRRYPDHRVAMHLRDLATQVESIKFLSPATLNAIRSK
jgi:hypothetical protein